jgi:hypothetical protein
MIFDMSEFHWYMREIAKTYHPGLATGWRHDGRNCLFTGRLFTSFNLE